MRREKGASGALYIVARNSISGGTNGSNLFIAEQVLTGLSSLFFLKRCLQRVSLDAIVL